MPMTETPFMGPLTVGIWPEGIIDLTDVYSPAKGTPTAPTWLSAAACAPDGKTIAFATGTPSRNEQRQTPVDQHRELLLWDLSSGKIRECFEAPSAAQTPCQPASALCFSPDGTKFVSAHPLLDAPLPYGSSLLRVWDVASRRQQQEFIVALRIGGIEVSASGDYLLLKAEAWRSELLKLYRLSGNGTEYTIDIRSWQSGVTRAATQQVVKLLRGAAQSRQSKEPSAPPAPGGELTVTAACLAASLTSLPSPEYPKDSLPVGGWILLGTFRERAFTPLPQADCELVLWNLQSQQVDFSFEYPATACGAITVIAMHPNGRHFVVGTDQGYLLIYDKEQVSPLAFMGQHDGPVLAARFLATSGEVPTRAVSADAKSGARLWEWQRLPQGGPGTPAVSYRMTELVGLSYREKGFLHTDASGQSISVFANGKFIVNGVGEPGAPGRDDEVSSVAP